MTKKWLNRDTIELFGCVLNLKNIDEAKKFFRDLMTADEIVEFGRRWKAAQMLNDKIPYSAIEKNTGLSSTTVARISKWLNDGTGGYKLMLAKMKKHHRAAPSFEKGQC